MASIKKVTIDNWDAGIQTSPDSNALGAATMIKNFDINTDPHRLIPLPSWEDWITSDETNYGIKGLGTFGTETVYGVGKRPTHTPNPSLQHYFDITITGASTGAALTFIPSSYFPDHFWENVQSDFGDLRATISTAPQTVIPTDVTRLDIATKSGYLVLGTAWANQTIRIFYNSSETLSVPFDHMSLNSTVYDSYFGAFTFGEDSTIARNWGSNGGDLGTVSTLAESYTSKLGNSAGLNENIVETDDNVFMFSGDDAYYMMLVKILPGFSSEEVFDQGAASHTMDIDANSVDVTWRKDVANWTEGPAISFEEGMWALIYTGHDGSDNTGYIKVWKENSTTADVDFSKVEGNGNFQYSDSIYQQIGTSNTVIDFLFASNNIPDGTEADGYAEQLWGFDSYFSAGSEQLTSGLTATYDGVALWKKDVDDSTWTIVEGSSVGSIGADGYYPIRGGFAVNEGGLEQILITNAAPDSDGEPASGTLYVGVDVTATGFDPDFATLDLFTPGSTRIAPVAVEGTDGDWYFAHGGGGPIDEITSSAVNEGAFTAVGTVTNLDVYGQYLVVASHRANDSFLQFWDYTSTTATELVNLGTGEVQVCGVVGGVPVAVVNKWIHNSDLSGNIPTMDIRAYNGSAYGELTHRIEMPTHYDPSTDTGVSMDKPINNLKAYSRSSLLFYAKLPADDTATTFNEGIWAVGRNDVTRRFNLSLYKETGSLGWVENMISIGHNLILVHDDSATPNDASITKVSRLNVSGTYSDTSSWESTYFDAGDKENKKRLRSLSLTYEELPSGQSVTVYYRERGDTTYTQLFTENTVDSDCRECTLVESTGTPLPHFKEIQFKIETTGGKSSINEFSFTYEETNDVT